MAFGNLGETTLWLYTSVIDLSFFNYSIYKSGIFA